MSKGSSLDKKALYLHFARLLGLGLGIWLGIESARKLGGDSVHLRVLVGGSVAGSFVLLWAVLCHLVFRQSADS